MQPEFEEKSFESAFNGELGASEKFRRTFSPGQQLEKHLGVDVLWKISKANPFWNAVLLTNRPGAFPASWSIRAVPAENFNLFLQYKRSDFLMGNSSPHRRHFGGDYYRFRANSPVGQLRTLQDLEIAVGTSGHVLYVAPAFHKLDELYEAQVTKTMVARSVIVRPSGFVPAHTAFNFQLGSPGLFNPEPQSAELRSAETLFLGGVDVSQEPAGVIPLIQKVEGGLSEISGWSAAWSYLSQQIPDEFREGPDSQVLRAFLQVATFAWANGLTWLFLEPTPPAP